MTRTRDVFDTFEFCEPGKGIAMTENCLENSEIGCGPIVNLHTFTLDNWDVKHEKTNVARHNGHLGPIVEHTHADSKGFYLAELL